MTMIMRLERTSEEVKTRARHVIICDNYPEKHRYRPLEGSSLKLRSLPRTALGRKITSAALRVLEGVRAVPKGAFEVQKILNIAADNLVAAGSLGIFTPMYYHKARKPG